MIDSPVSNDTVPLFESTAPDSTLKPPVPQGIKSFLALCLVISVLAGIASGWWFAAKQPAQDVYIVDVKGLVDGKKQELIERYKSNPSQETIAAADTELTEFLTWLDREITRLGNDGRSLVLIKDAVLAGNVTDVTDTIKQNWLLAGRTTDAIKKQRLQPEGRR